MNMKSRRNQSSSGEPSLPTNVLLWIGLHFCIFYQLVQHSRLAGSVALGDTVNAFKDSVTGKPVNLTINTDGTLSDTHSGTAWDARGKYKGGLIKSDLEMLAVSDEYWFSWKAFHPSSHLVRVWSKNSKAAVEIQRTSAARFPETDLKQVLWEMESW